MELADKLDALFNLCTADQLQRGSDYFHEVANSDPLLFIAGLIRSKLPNDQKRPLSEICVSIADAVREYETS